MKLVLVCHSEPDPAEAVAAELALRLTTLGPYVSVISSPAAEAMATAIARSLGDLPLSTDAGLMGPSESGLGRQVPRGFDDEMTATVAQIGEVAWATVERLIEETDPAATVIAVSHELTIAALVCRTLSMPAADYRRMRIDPASFTVLDLRPNRFRLLLLNETHHLDEPVQA